MSIDELEREIDNVTARMKTAANQLDFERAIQLREQVSNLTNLKGSKRKSRVSDESGSTCFKSAWHSVT